MQNRRMVVPGGVITITLRYYPVGFPQNFPIVYFSIQNRVRVRELPESRQQNGQNDNA